MIQQAQPWLPAACEGAFERQLGTLVEEWAAHWICGAPSLTIEHNERSPGLNWHGCRAAAIGIAPDALVALGQAALGNRADAANNRDGEILASIGQQAVADLAAHLGEIASPAHASGDLATTPEIEDGPCYRIAGCGWTLAVSLDRAAQVRLRKHVSGARRRPVLVKMDLALAPERVNLGCHLGRASLSAAEVGALARGDVIVLDRRTADELRLTVQGTVASRGKASVEPAATAHSIRITQPIDLAAGAD